MIRKNLFLFFFFGLCTIIPSLQAYELAIAMMFRNEAPYLKEWIEYHRLVGVEHFWLYNDTSTDNWKEVLAPYIKEGLVEAIDWSNRHGPGTDWVPAQMDAYKDAFRRASGNTTWVAPIDADEFIVPMKETTITECLRKHFSTASGIYINWLNFGTSGVTIPKGEPLLFRLTSCSLSSHSDNGVGKSIVRPECVHLPSVYYPHHFILSNNAPYVDGEGSSIKFDGMILPTDGRHKNKFIRINHYVLRDESCFKNKRLARASEDQKPILLEHYKSFSLVKDFSITKIILKHPEAYNKIWKPYIK